LKMSKTWVCQEFAANSQMFVTSCQGRTAMPQDIIRYETILKTTGSNSKAATHQTRSMMATATGGGRSSKPVHVTKFCSLPKLYGARSKSCFPRSARPHAWSLGYVQYIGIQAKKQSVQGSTLTPTNAVRRASKLRVLSSSWDS